MMRHALGKSPASGHDLYETFQNAGNQLLDEEWSWAKRNGTLEFVAGRDWVELPEDFGRVVSITPSTVLSGIEQVTAQRMALLRTGGLGINGIGQAVCFDAARRQNTVGLPSRVVADCYPTPAANDSVPMVYRRTFPRYTTERDNETPDIDVSADLLLSLMAQDLAFLIENKRRLFEPGVIDEEMARVRRLDGSRQWDHGRMSGGALDRLPSQSEATVLLGTITVT